MLFIKKIPRLLRWIFSVAIVFLLLLTFYRLLFFYHYKPLNKPFSGKAFFLGLRFDLRTVSVLALVMLLLNTIPFLNPFKNTKATYFWNITLSILFLIFCVFLGTDYFHYDYLHVRLNASVLSYLQDAAISFKMMVQTYPVVKIGLFFSLLLFLFWLFSKWLLNKYITTYISDSRRKPLAYVASFLLIAFFIFGKVGQYPLRWSDAFEFGDEFKSNVALNPFQSFFSSLKFRKQSYDINKVKESYPTIADYLDLPQKDTNNLNFERTIVPVTTNAKPNVVLVICESFSAYKSSMYGNSLNATPYFNELSKQGVFFDRCFTPAYGTARGVWATLTGIPDVEPPPATASRNPSAVNQHILMNDFNGYEKYYFLGGSASWANIRGLLTNNIDSLHLYEEGSYKAKKIDVWGISDKNLFLEANDVLKKENNPFFAIIQTADNHRPYTIPSEDIGAFNKVSFSTDTLKKYGFESNEELNAFRYTDFCYQQFMEAAKKENWYNNTIFVFVGDHGIRGDAGNMFPKSWTEQGLTCQHVPLLFYAPSLLKPLRQTQVCSQIDIMPSIAALSNQSLSYSTLGKNLFAPNWNNSPSYSFISDPDANTIGVLNKDYYYLQNLQSGKEQLVSMTENAINTDSAYLEKAYLKKLTNAYYQTSKYLITNNKKKVSK